MEVFQAEYWSELPAIFFSGDFNLWLNLGLQADAFYLWLNQKFDGLSESKNFFWGPRWWKSKSARALALRDGALAC